MRPHVRRGEDVERARAQVRRADGCFSARMGRSRWDRPGTPRLPLGRCVVRTGRAGGGTGCGRMFAAARACAKERRADRCFSARMGRSRRNRPGTPRLPRGRCVVRTGRAGRGTGCGRMFAAARACTKERRADGCFSARMGRSRWDRPGTPSLPLGRCVVRTGPAGGGTVCGCMVAAAKTLSGRARRNAARMAVSRRGRVYLDETDRGHKASPSADVWFGQAGQRGQQRRESLRTLLAHGPRNSLWVGVSWHGWLDHDGLDWGHQASPSTEAPFELGRCGRRRPRTHAQEQVFAIVTRSGKCTWMSVFHLNLLY